MRHVLRRHVSAALDLIWPPVCPACVCRARYPRDQFCEACWSSLRPAVAGDGGDAAGEFVLAAFVCDALFLQVLITSKYRRCRRVGWRLAREAAARLAPRIDPGPLVPVPLTLAKWRERGFNQTEDFAAALAAATGFPVAPGALRRVRGGRALAGLPREARRAAVAGAFAAAPRRENADPVWIVDDVVTTGSTTAACAAALRDAGFAVRGVLAMGRAFAASSDRPAADRSALARL